MKWLIVHPGQTVEVRTDPLTLDAAQAAVGGYIEEHRLATVPGMAYINEEPVGEPNAVAEAMLRLGVVRGPMVVMGPAGPDGEETPVTAQAEGLVHSLVSTFYGGETLVPPGGSVD